MLSESDIERLAKAVAKEVNLHPTVCPTFTAEEVAEIKGVASTLRQGKKVMLTTIIGFLVLGALGIFGTGFIAKVLEWMNVAKNAVPKG
jgi:hypothetical protein